MKFSTIFSTACSLLAASSLFGNAAAYHNLSPICTTNAADMQQSIHIGGPQNAAMAGWKMMVAKAAVAGQYTVTASGPSMTYGLVLRVQDGKTQKPAGAFVGPIPAGLTIRTDCAPSIITHIDNPASNNIAVTWDSQKLTGTFNVQAIVIGPQGQQWTIIGADLTIDALGNANVVGNAPPPAAPALQGIMQYRIYIISAGVALGIVAVAMVARIAIKRQQNSSKV